MNFALSMPGMDTPIHRGKLLVGVQWGSGRRTDHRGPKIHNTFWGGFAGDGSERANTGGGSSWSTSRYKREFEARIGEYERFDFVVGRGAKQRIESDDCGWDGDQCCAKCTDRFEESEAWG